ncbi:MAG: hypothetical protein BGP05_22180 [Rhizobiales bacterium 62-47]|nr:hypothetical protein [Hyphomicrobiales bacterium]OJY10375.1 MAG: hypothetical protein BGP05_22180 [Rhizobiales bacterium 62-47]
MNGEATTVPRNIWRFEALLYTSLLLDALSGAFQTLPDDLSETSASIASLVNALLILGFVFLVNLAARRRQGWARMVLLGALALSVVSLAGEMATNGGVLASGIELLSSALTAAGLYFSFTGDARGWFDPPRV